MMKRKSIITDLPLEIMEMKIQLLIEKKEIKELK